MISEHRIFDADLETVPEMIEFIEELTDNFSPKLSYDITLVCEEILVNIASYAYPDRDGQLAVLWENDTDNKKLRIEFEDSGLPFNPLEKEAPDLDVPIKERQIGGLGIMMVRKLMDDVKYSYIGGKNTLTVMKAY